jgi:hypothetical protein
LESGHIVLAATADICWALFIMQIETTPHQPVNHVFVDLENVKSIDATVLGGKHLRLHLFLGPQNKKLEVEVVEKLLENAQAVQLIRIVTVGKNALDFVLAYHLGQAVLTDPKGYFHIVSKDTGFDALVDLLKYRHVKVKRHVDWSALNLQATARPAAVLVSPGASVPQVKAAPKPAASQKVPAVPALTSGAKKLIENLRKLPKPKRPKKEKSLIAHAKPLCGKDMSEATVEKVLGELKKAKFIAVDSKGAVSYNIAEEIH